MTKREKELASAMALEMENFSPVQWANFNRRFNADEKAATAHEIDRTAYKEFLVKGADIGKGIITAGGFTAQVNSKRGQFYVDYAELLEELEKDMGINIAELVKKHTKQRPDTMTFTFK